MLIVKDVVTIVGMSIVVLALTIHFVSNSRLVARTNSCCNHVYSCLACAYEVETNTGCENLTCIDGADENMLVIILRYCREMYSDIELLTESFFTKIKGIIMKSMNVLCAAVFCLCCASGTANASTAKTKGSSDESWRQHQFL